LLTVLRPSISSPDQSSETSEINATVTASTTEDIDSVVYADLCRVSYEVCVYNTTEDVSRSFTLNGSKITGGGVEDQMHAIIGDVIDFDVEFSVVATNAVFKITNNETYDLTVEGVKIGG
jgi:hypothetical protein